MEPIVSQNNLSVEISNRILSIVYQSFNIWKPIVCQSSPRLEISKHLLGIFYQYFNIRRAIVSRNSLNVSFYAFSFLSISNFLPLHSLSIVLKTFVWRSILYYSRLFLTLLSGHVLLVCIGCTPSFLILYIVKSLENFDRLDIPQHRGNWFNLWDQNSFRSLESLLIVPTRIFGTFLFWPNFSN